MALRKCFAMNATHICLLIIMLAAASAAQCNGSSSMLVPAVVGQGSGLVNVSVRMISGDGSVFISTYPQTGTSTQQSMEDAALYAFNRAGVSGCDAIIRIDSGSAGYVEGPSAGAATAVTVYSAAEGMAPRHDAVMTGSVDTSGNVGPVGGLYEKALAATASGAEYFVTPKITLFDILLLRGVKNAYGLQILQASTMNEAIGFMLYNQTLKAPAFDQQSEPVPEVAQYDTSGMEGFGGVVSGMMYAESASIDAIPATDNESAAIKNFFRSEASRQGQILGKGYMFTAANEAFLDYIEVRTINAVLSGRPDLKAERQSALGCLASLPSAQKTDTNFQQLVGADLRRTWAQNKLNATDITAPEILEEKYVAYNELMYADAWCTVSGLLSASANDSGTPVSDSSWKDLASSAMSQAGKLDNLDQDMRDHLDSARLSFGEGRYGAALYDSMYVIETSKADSELADMSEPEVEAQVNRMLLENRTSLWGAIYQSHAAWTNSAGVSSATSAYRMLRYAEGLDSATSRMLAAINAQAPAGEQAPSAFPLPLPSLTDSQKTLAIASMFLMIILLLSYVAAKKAYEKGLSDGRRGTQGTRRVPGTGKKQG